MTISSFMKKSAGIGARPSTQVCMAENRSSWSELGHSTDNGNSLTHRAIQMRFMNLEIKKETG